MVDPKNHQVSHIHVQAQNKLSKYMMKQNVTKLWKNKIFSISFLMSTIVLIRSLLNVMLTINEIVRIITMSVMNYMYCALNGKRCINLSQLILIMIMINLCHTDINANIPCHASTYVSGNDLTLDVDLRSVKSDILCFNSIQIDVLIIFLPEQPGLKRFVNKNHGQGTRQIGNSPLRLVDINRTSRASPHTKTWQKSISANFQFILTCSEGNNTSKWLKMKQKIRKISHIGLGMCCLLTCSAAVSAKYHAKRLFMVKTKVNLAFIIFNRHPLLRKKNEISDFKVIMIMTWFPVTESVIFSLESRSCILPSTNVYHEVTPYDKQVWNHYDLIHIFQLTDFCCSLIALLNEHPFSMSQTQKPWQTPPQKLPTFLL